MTQDTEHWPVGTEAELEALEDALDEIKHYWSTKQMGKIPGPLERARALADGLKAYQPIEEEEEEEDEPRAQECPNCGAVELYSEDRFVWCEACDCEYVLPEDDSNER